RASRTSSGNESHGRVGGVVERGCKGKDVAGHRHILIAERSGEGKGGIRGCTESCSTITGQRRSDQGREVLLKSGDADRRLKQEGKAPAAGICQDCGDGPNQVRRRCRRWRGGRGELVPERVGVEALLILQNCVEITGCESARLRGHLGNLERS